MLQPGKTFVFATTSKGKLDEVSRGLSSLGVTIRGLQDFATLGEPPTVIEAGATYEEIACDKARRYAQWLGCACLADDTGLELGILGGLPGKYTARFGLERLRHAVEHAVGHTPVIDARFVCCMAYAEPSGRTVAVTCSIDGDLTALKVACTLEGPLPYARIFVPRGEIRPLSELTLSGDFLSHRVRAVRTLLSVLR